MYSKKCLIIVWKWRKPRLTKRGEGGEWSWWAGTSAYLLSFTIEMTLWQQWSRRSRWRAISLSQCPREVSGAGQSRIICIRLSLLRRAHYCGRHLKNSSYSFHLCFPHRCFNVVRRERLACRVMMRQVQTAQSCFQRLAVVKSVWILLWVSSFSQLHGSFSEFLSTLHQWRSLAWVQMTWILRSHLDLIPLGLNNFLSCSLLCSWSRKVQC